MYTFKITESKFLKPQFFDPFKFSVVENQLYFSEGF